MLYAALLGSLFKSGDLEFSLVKVVISRIKCKFIVCDRLCHRCDKGCALVKSRTSGLVPVHLYGGAVDLKFRLVYHFNVVKVRQLVRKVIVEHLVDLILVHHLGSFEGAFGIQEGTVYLLERQRHVGEGGNRRIGLARLLHLLNAHDDGVVLSVHHPVSSLESLLRQQGRNIYELVRLGKSSCLVYLKGNKMLSVLAHHQHITHTADVKSVALLFLCGTGYIYHIFEQRMAVKPPRRKISIVEHLRKSFAFMLKIIVDVVTLH